MVSGFQACRSPSLRKENSPLCGKNVAHFFCSESGIVQGDGVSGDFFQTDASDAGCLCAEIASQQFLADPYGFKNLRAPIGTDRRDTHLAHDFKQALADGFDIILFGRFIIHLHIAFSH